jgi:hypothetical protein
LPRETFKPGASSQGRGGSAGSTPGFPAAPCAAGRHRGAEASQAEAHKVHKWIQGSTEGPIPAPRLGDRLPVDQTMDGRTLKFLNVIDEYSQVCLAIRVGRRRTAVDLSSLPMPCRSGAQATVKQGHISRQVHPGRIHLWNHSTKDLGINSCRRSRPEATY